jgi:DNA helicase-2/ATP-dependent DNA helicase PcrA
MNFNELEKRYLAAKRRLFDIYYDSLNDRQREAVFTADGSLLVLAGAGSGKTTVLVKRIVYLIQYGNAYYSNYVPFDISESKVQELEQAATLPKEAIEQILPEFISAPCAPWNMLAITFTNKAANEIKNRLSLAVGDEETAKSIWAGTFHSICMRILRVYGDRLGYKSGFTVYDADDSKSAITSVMKNLNIDTKLLSVKSVINEISRAKDNLMTPEQYERELSTQNPRYRQISRIYYAYRDTLKSANALDFDDIIMQTVLLLESDEEVRAYYQKKFRYVCVDEFQDTNAAQFKLTALLAGGYNNIMVVGDDDQSIYKFRGAVIDNILSFDRKFKDTKIIKLEQNYRSTSIILNAANGVISKNLGRKGKELWTDKEGGDKISLKICEDTSAESRYLAERINELVAAKKYSYKDIAILYRMNVQSRIIEQTFTRSGIPYRILGGLRFSDRKEIRDLVAYLQLIVNFADRERFKRIVNEPKRAIGAKTVEAVLTISEEQSCPVMQVLRDADKYAALGRSAEKLKQFYDIIAGLRKLLDTDISLEAFVGQVLDRTGYRQMLIDAGEEEKDRLDNIEEFISGVIEYEKSVEEPTLVGFLEENSLVADVDRYDESADAVVMMTVHSAKGLEFPVVFLPGMEEGVFPSMQTINSLTPDADMEEERRLAYVALTRAKKQIYITRATVRRMNEKTSCNPPSRFIEEIPSEFIVEARQNYAYSNAPRTYYSESSKIPERPKNIVSDRPYNSNINRKPAGNLGLKEGDRVRHITFGEGEILSARQMGADVLYEVIFDRVGTKKLMGTYARLTKL